MKSIKIRYIVFVFLIAISGCRKDEKTEGPIIMGPTGDPTIEVESGVTGIVTNEDGTPVSSASVMVYNKQVKTDNNGIFYINNEGLKKTNSLVHVQKAGYFDGYKSFISALGSKSFIQIQMVGKGSTTKINSSVGGIVEIEGGGKLVLPANSLVVKNGGAPYTGEINVFTHWYDPTDLDLGLSMPGNLLGIASDESEVQLATYGMIAVELESPNGTALQLKENAKATLEFPVSSSMNPPNTVPLWSFDESDGVWVQEGLANLEDGIYKAEVSHFSFWNCDAPYPLVNIVGRIVDDGIPVSNYSLTIITDNLIAGYSNTDSEGEFRGKVPKGENLVLIMRQCGETTVTYDLGSFDDDMNVGDIEVDLANFLTVLKGRMIGCFDEPLQSGYGLVMSGNIVEQVITPIANDSEMDGVFSTVVTGCQNGLYTVQFFDPENIKSTGLTTLSPDIEVLDLKDVRICDELEEFIQYSVDGEVAPLITDANVYFSNGEKIIIRGGQSGGIQSFDMDVFASSFGEYNASSMAIQGSLGPNNPELQMMCGDHFTNAFECSQFNVSISSFGEFVSGTFSGSLVANRDSINSGSLDFEEFFIEGTFRVRIDEFITTGEISGQFWFDENDNNVREDIEDQQMEVQSVYLRKLSGSGISLFPNFLLGYNQSYKFTDLQPGTYIVRVGRSSGYEIVIKDVGSDDRDCDFSDDGLSLFGTDEMVISNSETIENVDLGYKLPTSVKCGNLFAIGCAPNITLSTSITGGVPPYQVTLNNNQTIIVDDNPVFTVTQGGDYFIEVVDAVENLCTTEGVVRDYNNRVSGKVWRDVEGGTPDIFDNGDIRMNGVVIFLRGDNGNTFKETQTDENGLYRFENIPPGFYYIEIDLPNGLQWVDKLAGLNVGSHINPETNRTDVFQVGDCNSFNQLDAGLKPN